MSESAVVSACIKTLWSLDCYAFRMNTGAYKPEGSKRFIRYGVPGGADILFVSPSGRFGACECKFGKNKQSDLQKVFQERVEERGGIYIVAYSVDDVLARKDEIIGGRA